MDENKTISPSGLEVERRINLEKESKAIKLPEKREDPLKIDTYEGWGLKCVRFSMDAYALCELKELSERLKNLSREIRNSDLPYEEEVKKINIFIDKLLAPVFNNENRKSIFDK